MKHVFTILSVLMISVFFVACKQQPQSTLASQAAIMTPEKAAEFAEFEAWKQQKAILEAKELLAEKEAQPKVIYVSRPTRTVVQRPARTVQSAPVSQAATQPVAQKKKWSAAAKGAVIGAGVGAVGGAVVAKNNRALGAVIGAVAGGGAGFGIGKIIDKKNGR